MTDKQTATILKAAQYLTNTAFGEIFDYWIEIFVEAAEHGSLRVVERTHDGVKYATWTATTGEGKFRGAISAAGHECEWCDVDRSWGEDNYGKKITSLGEYFYWNRDDADKSEPRMKQATKELQAYLAKA